MMSRFWIACGLLLPCLVQSAVPATNQAQAALAKQLEAWVIPNLQLRQATLEEAATAIRAAAQEAAPEAQPLRVRVHPDAAAGSSRITMTLRRVPMNKLLNYVTEVASVGWMFEGDEIVIVPRDHPGAQNRRSAGAEPLTAGTPAAATNLPAFHFEVYQVSEREASELGRLLPMPAGNQPLTYTDQACQPAVKRLAMMSGKRLLCALDKTSRLGVGEPAEQKKVGSTVVEINCTSMLRQDGQCYLELQSGVTVANQAATAPGSCLFSQPGTQVLLLHIPAPVAGRGSTKYYVTLIKYLGQKTKK